MSVAALASFETHRADGHGDDVVFGTLTPLAKADPVPTLPEDLLPEPLRAWVVDVSNRLQVPLELAAVPAILTFASLIGRRVGIHPKASDDWLVVPNLWGGIVARPGMLKSPTLAETIGPLKRLSEARHQSHEEQMDAIGARHETLKAKEAGIKERLRTAHKKQADEHEIESLEGDLTETRREIREHESTGNERRYIVNDTTTEKLGELFRTNTQGLLLYRDKLAGWLRSLERDDRKSDREFFLEAWNGQNAFSYDRISRGTIHIPALCLSIVGGIQPAKLARYVAEGVEGGWAADGLIQRFQLLVWPDDQRNWRLVDRQPDAVARQRVVELAGQVDALPIPRDREAVPALRFDPGAQALFYDWLTQLEARLRAPEMADTPAFESHLAKYRSLMPSLALIFQILSHGVDHPVSISAARLAADWCEFLERHARKVYRCELDRGGDEALALAWKIRDGAVTPGMPIRDIYSAGWSRLKTRDAVLRGVDVLVEHQWVRTVSRGTGGRPSPRLVFHPKLLDSIDGLIETEGASR